MKILINFLIFLFFILSYLFTWNYLNSICVYSKEKNIKSNILSIIKFIFWEIPFIGLPCMFYFTYYIMTPLVAVVEIHFGVAWACAAFLLSYSLFGTSYGILFHFRSGRKIIAFLDACNVYTWVTIFFFQLCLAVLAIMEMYGFEI